MIIDFQETTATARRLELFYGSVHSFSSNLFVIKIFIQNKLAKHFEDNGECRIMASGLISNFEYKSRQKPYVTENRNIQQIL